MSVKTSFSAVDALRQCQLKHHLAYVERWKPPKEAPQLARGTLFHEVLATHYNTLQATATESGVTVGHLDLAVDAVADLLNRRYDDENAEMVDLVGWIYGGYVEQYAEDEEWKVMAVESRLKMWLPAPGGGRSNVLLEGVIDLIVEWQGGLWIVDHKTCQNLPSGRELDLDDQMAVYVYLARRAGLEVEGAVYNACRHQRNKSKPQALEDRFKREYTIRTDYELETCVDEVRRLVQEGWRVSRGDVLPPRSPNPDTCKWRCPYTEACLFGRKGHDLRDFLETTGFTQSVSSGNRVSS